MAEPWTEAEERAARAAVEAASPGPWVKRGDEDGHTIWAERTLNGRPCRVRMFGADLATVADSGFIALARTALPRALDELARVRAERARLLEELTLVGIALGKRPLTEAAESVLDAAERVVNERDALREELRIACDKAGVPYDPACPEKAPEKFRELTSRLDWIIVRLSGR